MTKPSVFLPTLAQALVLALTTAVFTAPATAKPLSRILAESPLQPGDFNAMRAAEAALYNHAGVKVGSSVKWTNPETAAHGKVKVIAKQGNCLALKHQTYPGGAAQARDIARKFCKASDGKWLLTE
jgi:surface antigen